MLPEELARLVDERGDGGGWQLLLRGVAGCVGDAGKR
jgi:hypothetical protein